MVSGLVGDYVWGQNDGRHDGASTVERRRVADGRNSLPTASDGPNNRRRSSMGRWSTICYGQGVGSVSLWPWRRR